MSSFQHTFLKQLHEIATTIDKVSRQQKLDLWQPQNRQNLAIAFLMQRDVHHSFTVSSLSHDVATMDGYKDGIVIFRDVHLVSTEARIRSGISDCVKKCASRPGVIYAIYSSSTAVWPRHMFFLTKKALFMLKMHNENGDEDICKDRFHWREDTVLERCVDCDIPKIDGSKGQRTIDGLWKKNVKTND
jgi:hypothetical protein